MTSFGLEDYHNTRTSEDSPISRQRKTTKMLIRYQSLALTPVSPFAPIEDLAFELKPSSEHSALRKGNSQQGQIHGKTQVIDIRAIDIRAIDVQATGIRTINIRVTDI